MVLADAQRQGLVARNAAEHVDPVAVSHRSVDTYTETEPSAGVIAILAGRSEGGRLRPVKLHAARHTAGTAMHLAGVCIWLEFRWR
jgi:hypothetical protein